MTLVNILIDHIIKCLKALFFLIGLKNDKSIAKKQEFLLNQVANEQKETVVEPIDTRGLVRKINGS